MSDGAFRESGFTVFKDQVGGLAAQYLGYEIRVSDGDKGVVIRVSVEECRVPLRHDHIKDSDIIVFELQVMPRLAADRNRGLREGGEQADQGDEGARN